MHVLKMRQTLALVAIATASLSACESPSEGPAFADFPLPAEYGDGLKGRGFTDTGGIRYVPADFESVRLSLSFDVRSKETTGHAEVRFRPVGQGVPYFLITAPVRSAKVNGQPVTLHEAFASGRQTRFKGMGVELADGVESVLELEYGLSGQDVTYDADGVRIVTSMADISDGNFFEPYGPASLEADQFLLSLELSIEGGTATHRLFTNGDVTSASRSRWTVEFPAYFNTSAIYFHLTHRALTVRETVHQGLIKDIPITIYSQSQASADAAMAKIHQLFTELEGTYGPYLHDSFTAYIAGSGGMEHSGATITGVSALGHELTHSWFARGVFPADGRSGWIDEAIASWRDYDYQRSTAELSRKATNLANLPIWEIFTPSNVYVDGRALLAELDGMFASSSKGGLKPVLKSFFAAWGGRAVTTEQFRQFMEAETGMSLGARFDKYVYGQSLVGKAESPLSSGRVALELGFHPPALTREEILELR